MGDKIIKAVQVMTYPFMNFYFRWALRVEVVNNLTFDKNEKYIFAPNHQRYIDPFIVFYSLPFRDVYPLLPLKFMATPVYVKKFFIGGVMKLFGCYDSSEDSLKKSVDFLRSGSTICIFPQGKFDKRHKGKAKVGVIYIQREVEGSTIVPVNIKYYKKKTRIVFIKKVKNKRFPKNLQPLADKILKIVKEGK